MGAGGKNEFFHCLIERILAEIEAADRELPVLEFGIPSFSLTLLLSEMLVALLWSDLSRLVRRC